MLAIGSVIDGKYKVLSEIGHGGMSTVYLAINEKANKPWAIKEVRKDGIQNFEIVRQSLIVETNLLKRLSHPNLPSIVDIIDRDDDFLIVMDYVEGVTLDKIVKEEGPQKQEDVVNWAIQICDVLEYLHTGNPPIIYRDMKPSNIMLKNDGSVVLIDFGTAREFKTNKNSDTTCLGTQGYAAPEQFGGNGQTDARTDVYCLGATMYHLLTGHNPSEPPYEMYPITYWDNTLSGGLEGIVLKCTQKNPEDRFASAAQLRDALSHYRDLDGPALKRYRRRLGTFLATAVMAVVCGVASLGFHFGAVAEQESEYEFLLDAAEKSSSEADKVDYYLQAIRTDSQREDAYISLLDSFIEDGIFEEQEEQILLQLNASVDKYLQKFEANNPTAYAQFCFDLGNAYWYYYVHEESRQSGAVPWFATAANYFETMEEHQMEYKRCSIYMEIGNFYKKIVAAQIEGTDTGMYGEYWNSLMQLKKYNDENPDRELITLRLYREIVTRSTEYAKYLREDGVSEEDIRATYAEISADMKEMQENATGTVTEEIENVKRLMEQADQMITSSYKEDTAL